MTVKEVQVAELADAMQAGARVVDVRETNEYVEGHVPGAVHVALSTVPDHVEAFRGTGPTYVVCRSGARSMRACEFLVQQGIDVVNVAGGTLDWIASGRSVVTGDSPRVTHRWIDSTSELAEFVDRALTEPRYAMDTEFHRERTYFPRLALVQIAAAGEIVLIDPMACDLSPLIRLFDSEVQAVLHAAQQDLDVLHHAVHAVPRRMYDTQLAAGFVGYSTPSLVSLLQGELKVTAAKGDRLTDWLHRPLTSEQREYAASDVEHLLALQDVLEAKLAASGRVEWAQAACLELLAKPVSGTDPDAAWTRLKDVRVLKPKARGVARALAAWRERRAMSIDSPVRQVLPDLAILGIAQKQPRTIAELGQARGVDERHTRGIIGKEILGAVAEGLTLEASLPAPDGEDLDRSMRPAVALVSAWVSEVARESHIDTALLATRNDLVAFLRGDSDARLAVGWRHDLLGDGIRRLVAGKAALTFDGRGGLNLIDVPG